MGINEIRDVFMWCTIIDFGILSLWFAMFAMAGGWIYRCHGKWFPMSRDAFNAIHYAGMALFKVVIFVFNLVPYLALLIVS